MKRKSNGKFPTDKELEARLLPFNDKPVGWHSFSDTEKMYSELLTQPVHSLDLCPADTPPPDTQAAFDDVFADLIKSHGACLKLHPTLRRWTVYLKGADGQYHPAIIICENWHYSDELPADLASALDPRLHVVVKGQVGEYRVPTRADFEHLRYTMADIQYLGGHRAAASRHRDADLKRLRSKAQDRRNWIRGFVNYYAAEITRDANRMYGSMQGLPFVPGQSTEAVEREFPAYEEVDALDPETGRKLGYKHRRRLSEIERELQPVIKQFIAMQAAQKRWQAEYNDAKEGMRPFTMALLKLAEPIISDTERRARVAAFIATRGGAAAAEAAESAAAGTPPDEVIQELLKTAKDEADKRIADSTDNIDAVQAKVREENRKAWLSRVQPQSL